MRSRHMEDLWRFDDQGKLIDEWADYASKLHRTVSSNDRTTWDGPENDSHDDTLDGSESPFGDDYFLELTAGVTYSFALRPASSGGIEDPFLIMQDADFNVLSFDDDGGAGRSSIVTFTPTETDIYVLSATSWVNLFAGGGDTGGYTLHTWTAGSSPDAPNSMVGAVTIQEDVTTFGQMETSTDIDMYKMDLTAGRFYTFAVSGGTGSEGTGDPHAVTAKIDLLDSNGNLLVSHNATESGVGWDVLQDGTYYVRITPTNASVGGYTLDVDSVVLADLDPLEAFNWDSADNIPTTMVGDVETAYVYFANAGENFGAQQGDSNAPIDSLGWNDFEKQQVMLMLQEYTFITGINYVMTNDPTVATFRLITTTNEPYGARFFPNDADVYGDQTGIGIFNKQSHAWTFDANGPAPGSQQSLLKGGWAWELLLHEFGHGHGIAHPHDNGGGSEIMAGVFASQGSFGAYNLNQSVYSVMSYNSSWVFHPNGPTPFSVSSLDNGSSGGLNPFDIAILQNRYGVVERNTGNDVYTLTDVKPDAEYKTIWDSGGNDTIAYNGTKDAQIDLIAATLDYSPTGGGVISFLFNPPGTPAAQLIRGGFLIANGVVVENATGGSGNDILLGNSANNVLTGNAGNDTLAGRTGIDLYRLGAGADTAIVSLDNTKVDTKVGSLAYDIVADFDGSTDKVDFSDLDAKIGTAANDAFTWVGTNSTKNAGTLGYKVYDSVNGAEKALGIEIDSISGAHSGKVTVVMANVDGGGVDYAVVLLGAPQLDATDFTL